MAVWAPGSGSQAARAWQSVFIVWQASPAPPPRRLLSTPPSAPHRLTGFKWFTSAADGEMSMALAREMTNTGSGGTAGSGGGGGLTLFFVPVQRDEQGRPQAGSCHAFQRLPAALLPTVGLLGPCWLLGKGLAFPVSTLTTSASPSRPQGFEIVRLKQKLGTRQLPTAELRLTGMRALKVRRRPGGRPLGPLLLPLTGTGAGGAAISVEVCCSGF